MKRLIIAIGILSVLFFIALCIGFFLPDQRIETRRMILDAPQNEVFTLVTDHHNWQWRSDLKNLTITTTNGDKTVWIETNKSGQETHFKTSESIPYSLYSFEMESAEMQGYWMIQFHAVNNEQTELITTIYIQATNPLYKLISFIVFDYDAFIETYQNDLNIALQKQALIRH